MEIEKRILEKEGYRIRYTLQYKKVKNIILRISEQGEIQISCNPYVPIHKIEEFVLEKMTWVIQKQKHVLKQTTRHYEDCMYQNTFFLYDQELQIVRRLSNQDKVLYDEQNLYLYYTKEENMEKTMQQFINKKCEQDFKEVVDVYYEKLKEYGFSYPLIKYRTMKSRWGSCTPAKNQICLNKRMLHYPTAFLEYVVLHELVHFVQPNHSDSFYRIIAFHMPDYKQRMYLYR